MPSNWNIIPRNLYRPLICLILGIIGLYNLYYGVEVILFSLTGDNPIFGFFFIFLFPIWMLAFGLYCLRLTVLYWKGTDSGDYRDLSFTFWFLIFFFTLGYYERFSYLVPSIPKDAFESLFKFCCLSVSVLMHHLSGLILNKKAYNLNNGTLALFCFMLWLTSSEITDKLYEGPSEKLFIEGVVILGPLFVSVAIYKTFKKRVPNS
jgi:hypothetical protein